MKKNIITVLMLFFIVYFVPADIIESYDYQKVGQIKVGSALGEIGHDSRLMELGDFPGPATWTISDEGIVYICDKINFKINMYDLNMTYVNHIKNANTSSLFYADIIVIDDSNIIAYERPEGIIKVNASGQLIYEISDDELSWNTRKKYNFFVLGGYLLYYDDEGFSIKDPLGGDVSDFDINFLSDNNISNDIIDKSNDFFKEKKLIYNSVYLLNRDVYMHREFFKYIKQYSSDIRDKKLNIINNLSDVRFVNHDRDGNSYWNCYLSDAETKVILVLSKYGEILDYFYNTLNYDFSAVSPDGDVYFMDFEFLNADYIHFYKITRRW